MVSKQPDNSLPHDVPATGVKLAICCLIMVLFVVAATVNAARKDISQGFDEIAHASYVAHIQENDDVWPVLDDLKMLDAATGHFTDKANYLNHPPAFYAFMAALGPRLEGDPEAVFVHRVINIVISGFGLAALMALGVLVPLSRLEFYAFLVPLAAIPVLVPLAAAINNDNLVFAAGEISILAAWRLLTARKSWWLGIMLGAMVLAAWTKLTGLLLVGGFMAAFLFLLIIRGRLPWHWLVMAGGAFVLAAAPYVYFLVLYGSPAPETVAQLDLLRDGAAISGWDNAPRLGFAKYTVHFVTDFVANWMPTLATRTWLHMTMLIIPIVTLLCATAGIFVAIGHFLKQRESFSDIIVVAGGVALVATMAVNIIFSYQRHLATGWMLDAYPRYYLPLAVIVPLACIVAISTISREKYRKTALFVVIIGPLLFSMFGAPLPT